MASPPPWLPALTLHVTPHHPTTVLDRSCHLWYTHPPKATRHQHYGRLADTRRLRQGRRDHNEVERDPTEVVHEITMVKEVTTCNGPNTILSLRAKDGKQCTAWAPDHVATEISKQHKYVYNRGLVQTKNDSLRQYWDLHLP